MALVMGLAGLLLLAYRDNKKAVLRAAIAIMMLSIIYTGVSWNSTSLWARPIHGIRSVAAEPGTRDYESNLYRVLEKWNIVYNMRSGPLFGIGFGNKFDMPIGLATWQGSLREYIPHNSVLWIWLKTGAPGFFALLALLGLTIARTANVYRRVEVRQLKPWLAVGLLFIPMYMVYSYVDQGWDYKGMIYLGVVLGSYALVEDLASHRKA